MSQPIALPIGRSHWQLDALPPLALYIHIPWCVKKCPYCDFNSHAAPQQGIDDLAYIAALLRDIEQALPLVWGRRISSIFIGGGTPSLLSSAALDQLLTGVRTLLTVLPEAEITLEANPGTVESAKFRDFRVSGITRLSIGVQSFDDAQLRVLGRIHDSAEARRAVEIARREFSEVNIDLMYALPAQTLDAALSDLAQALALDPTHLSAYHLTLEPNTLFHRYPPARLPDDDCSADMQEAIEARLADAGFAHYETSAFAQLGHACRHNINYWQFGDYLGIGAGAHSKLSFHDRIMRQIRYKQPAAYLNAVAQGSAVQSEHTLTQAQLPFEFMMNALRLIDGVELTLFQARTGLALNVIAAALAQAETQGLLARDLHTLRPTLRGQRFLNDLLTLFLTEESP